MSDENALEEIAALRAKLAEAERELAEARKDKERLDSKQIALGNTWYTAIDLRTAIDRRIDDPWGKKRAAIDAARAGTDAAHKEGK